MKKIVIVAIIAVFLILFFQCSYVCTQEQITLSTYYPAPYGEYPTLAVGGYTTPDPGSATEEKLVVDGNVYIGTDNTNGTITDPNIGLVVEGGAISHAENNTFFGNQVATHINLGIDSETGVAGDVDASQTVGGGYRNTAGGDYATVSGGSFNTASDNYCTVAGGRDNQALRDYCTIGGGSGNSAGYGLADMGNYSTVLGGRSNIASGNYSTILGGYVNTITQVPSRATILGGYNNVVADSYGVIGGGGSNTASGIRSVVFGGSNNTISTSGDYGVISGGSYNYVSSYAGTITGGRYNRAYGQYATVSGGYRNTAGGDYSWAGGRYMKLGSSADRTFIWGYSPSSPASLVGTSDAFLIFPYGNAGKVGIGTRNPEHAFNLHVDTSVSPPLGFPSTGILVHNTDTSGTTFCNLHSYNSTLSTSHFGIGKASPGFNFGGMNFGGAGYFFNGDNTPIRFFTDGYNYAAANNLAGAQKMIITGNGRVGIGTGDPSYRLHVQYSRTGGYAAYFSNEGVSSTRYGIGIRAGSSTSGTLVRFYNGANTSLGSISFSGGTVTYGNFTGSHPATIPEKDNDAGYDYGTIVCVIKVNSNAESYQPAYCVEPCEQPNDPSVLGVYAPGDNEELEEESEDDIDNQHTIFALGDGHVLVTNINGEINRGDYVTSSPVRGHGQRQDDDIMHNYTVAKIMEQIDWEKVTETIEYNGRKYKKALLACIYHSG